MVFVLITSHNLFRYQNDHTAIHFMVISAKRWFGYVLDNLQLIFVSGSLLVLILFAEKFSGSLIGLIVTYLLMFNGEFQWGIICWSNLETCLCSVDRIERMGINLDSGYFKTLYLIFQFNF